MIKQNQSTESIPQALYSEGTKDESVKRLQLASLVDDEARPKIQKHWDMMNYSDVAAYLSVSTATVKRWVQMEKIPYFKFCGSLVRFRKSQIDEWLETGSATGRWDRKVSGSSL